MQVAMIHVAVILAAHIAASASGRAVPVIFCSWKPFTDSPESHGYHQYCSAEKQTFDDTAAWYSCDGHQDTQVVADIGFLDPFPDLLRFKAACPKDSQDGWGYKATRCQSEAFAVCLGGGSPHQEPTACYVSLPWPNNQTEVVSSESLSQSRASTRAMTVSTSRIGNIGPSLAQQIPDPWPLYQAYGLVDSVVPSKLPRRCRSGSRSSDAMGLPMLAITDISSNSSKTFTLHDSPANGSTTILPSVTDTLQCTRSSITLEPVEADAVSPPACCLALWLLSLRA